MNLVKEINGTLETVIHYTGQGVKEIAGKI